MDIHQAKELLQRYREGNCTHAENELVESWYKQLIDTGEWQWGKGEKDMMQKVLEARIMKKVNEKQKAHTRYLFPHSQWWAVAASVILLLGAFGYFMFFNKNTKLTQVAKVLPTDVNAPQSNKAMITLANGQKVYLDSAVNGALAIQGNVKLVKLAGGKIAYQQNSGEASAKMEYNTLSNPRGSNVIDMSLADGSKVWLDAGSSLRYPVSFIGSERKVSVTGEAYFEVAHDASKPFIVNNGPMDIKVLGTHFNVNAFEDDGNDIKVTLLEGSVKINNGNATGLLKPGQQALVNKKIKVVNDVDLDLVMAWKNGYFQFDNASLQSVLKQISRWYDVDIIYEGNNQPRQFVGEMERQLILSEVLKILQKNKVQFKLEGKQLTIMPD
ncbi:MAG: FecR domain-containing protein [Bacteroidota bacterium]|nr:FecR domain-containing protein [Bacteroidota bacterium]